MPEVALSVGGTSWGGWTRIRVQRGIEQIAGSFQLGLTERWPDQPDRREIRPGDACTIAIDGATVVTGHVDDVEVSFDGNNHSLSVSGRDATGDLVDCSADHKPGEIAGRTLTQLAQELCRPFGIDVRADVDVGAAFEKFTIQKSETVWEALERAARQRGVLLVADGRGGLLITRAAGGGHAVATLREGNNLLAARGTYSMRDRHSRYTVLSQTSGSDWTLPEDHAEPAGQAIDPAVGRYRPRVIIAEEQDDSGICQRRADWEARVRAGRARRVEADVQGWRHGGGIWTPNTLVRVSSNWLRVDQDMLIAGVELSLSERGTLATLSLIKPEAFDLIPLPEKEETGW
jgi:prophage tail gpP-like protein